LDPSVLAGRGAERSLLQPLRAALRARGAQLRSPQRRQLALDKSIE